MAQLTKRLATLLAAIVLGTTFLASGANAAVPASDADSIAAVPADSAQTVTVDGGPDRDGVHHRRFCLRLNAVLSRLVTATSSRGSRSSGSWKRSTATRRRRPGQRRLPPTQRHAVIRVSRRRTLGACSAHLRGKHVVVALTLSHQTRVPIGDDDHSRARRHVVVARHRQLIGAGCWHRDDFANARQR